MPGKFLPLTPEFQDITFSLQCSLSPHNPQVPDNLLSTPMINKKAHWHSPFLFGFQTLRAPREILFSSAASVLSLAWGEGQLWHCIAVRAHYQQRKEIPHKSYWFRKEPFTTAKLQSPNCNPHRCFFSQTSSATLKQLSFCKENVFSSSGKFCIFLCWHSDELLLLLNFSLWSVWEPAE